MKLFYMPGACSLAPHIVANEAGIDLELVKVDGASKTTEAKQDYLATNPNGYVPALVLDDGETLTEATVVMQYLADRKPDSGLIPASGEMNRYRVQQWLNFVATELHKGFSPLFRPNTPEETRTINKEQLTKRVKFLDTRLADRSYLMGDVFSVADAYLWTVLGWAKHVGLDLSGFANVQRFLGTVAARPAVQKSLREEGLA
ncbi:glutathione S-transferase [Mesorhizobium sp. Root552]|jgi:glutathione S-transferase|uniref:glutathione transferase GstA n=1 Tax=Mesorhizobium sp. Root552 TaxID=1736555 RepID=UPI0006F4E5CE|nr:glutathione transferase GstA [Mesorhizobium sp. Root552]KQZ19399.1 glutathione S-transferase [Mesorhizobium sp. Root552]